MHASVHPWACLPADTTYAKISVQSAGWLQVSRLLLTFSDISTTSTSLSTNNFIVLKFQITSAPFNEPQTCVEIGEGDVGVGASLLSALGGQH